MEFANKMRTALIEQVGQERFELWFGEDARFETNGARLRVLTDTAFRVDRLRKVFLRDIQSALVAIGMPECAVEFASRARPAADDSRPGCGTAGACESTPPQTESTPRLARPAPATHRAPHARLHAPSSKRRGRTFRSFNSLVAGQCNQLAIASTEMVMGQLGEVSPLVIHGPTGVGKTHLLEAVWCQARKQHRRSRVLYLSAEQFTTYFLEALKGNGLPSFRRKYRQADLLLIDDIQFFAGKQATLVELTYTIDELARQGRQLVLTADRPPLELSALGKELAARLQGGLVCGMKSLDHETMERLCKRWAVERRIVNGWQRASACRIADAGRRAAAFRRLTSSAGHQPGVGPADHVADGQLCHS